MAFNNTHTLEIGLINYLCPAITILFSTSIFGKKKGNLLLLPSALVALTVVFLATAQGTNLAWSSFTANIQKAIYPYLTGFLAAISWELYFNLSRRLGGNVNESTVPVFTIITGLVFAIIAIVFPEKMSWNSRVILEIKFFNFNWIGLYLLG